MEEREVFFTFASSSLSAEQESPGFRLVRGLKRADKTFLQRANGTWCARSVIYHTHGHGVQPFLSTTINPRSPSSARRGKNAEEKEEYG